MLEVETDIRMMEVQLDQHLLDGSLLLSRRYLDMLDQHTDGHVIGTAITLDDKDLIEIHVFLIQKRIQPEGELHAYRFLEL